MKTTTVRITTDRAKALLCPNLVKSVRERLERGETPRAFNKEIRVFTFPDRPFPDSPCLAHKWWVVPEDARNTDAKQREYVWVCEHMVDVD